MSKSSIEDSLSANINNMIGLRALNLSNNVMTGTLPIELPALTNLTELYLDSVISGIYGESPECICNMTQLQVLRLCWNRFGPQLPSQLARMTSLSILALNCNFSLNLLSLF
ncbi:hypothetical protein EON65_27735 [archaeon]|nr:MAG: hypothetical protein EON65_27735 [archaeon]